MGVDGLVVGPDGKARVSVGVSGRLVPTRAGRDVSACEEGGGSEDSLRLRVGGDRGACGRGAGQVVMRRSRRTSRVVACRRRKTG